MPEAQAFPLKTKSGRSGQVFRKARFLDRNDVSRVRLDDGTELSVPAASLTVQADGSFVLDDAMVPGAQAEQSPEIPAAPRDSSPRKSSRSRQPEAVDSTPAPVPPAKDGAAEAGARATTGALETAAEAPDSVAEPIFAETPEKTQQEVHPMAAHGEAITMSDALFTEDVDVERIPVNRILDAPVEVRQEGDTTIIPVIEEVITVQKRLLLREEVRITRRRVEFTEPRRVVLNQASERTFGADGRQIETKP